MIRGLLSDVLVPVHVLVLDPVMNSSTSTCTSTGLRPEHEYVRFASNH